MDGPVQIVELQFARQVVKFTENVCHPKFVFATNTGLEMIA